MFFYRQDFKYFIDNSKAVSYLTKLLRAMRKDDCDTFVNLTQREHRMGSVRRAGIVFNPSLLLVLAINYRAISCATSILDGKACLRVYDVNEAPNSYDPPPIIAAATKFLPEMINILAIHGARFSDRCSSVFSLYHSMLPLEAAVAELKSLFLSLLVSTIIYYNY